MQYILWQWDGHYIQGNKLYTYKTLTAAKKRAKGFDNYTKLEKGEGGWYISGPDGQALGMIEPVKE